MIKQITNTLFRLVSSKPLTAPAAPPDVSTSISTLAPTLLVHFSTKERVSFAKRLAFLMQSGVSLLESLTIIRNQVTNRRKRRVFDTIVDDVAAGRTLFHSLERYKNLFGEVTINIIKTGESASALPENLTYLADELAKKQALESKIKSALIYPAFITISTIGVTSLLVVFIFPKIMPVFISLNVELPWTTRALLAVSEYLQSYGLITVIGLLFLIVMIFISRTYSKKIRRTIDWITLELPIVGSIARSYNCANFCRALALNLRSGIPLSQAIYTTADVTGNTLYKKALNNCAERVNRGEKIATAITQYPKLFPDLLPHMLLIGETTGRLTDTLVYLSDLLEAEVDESTKNLSNSLEPFLLITMGLLVGLIAVSVITPIYEVTKHIGAVR